MFHAHSDGMAPRGGHVTQVAGSRRHHRHASRLQIGAGLRRAITLTRTASERAVQICSVTFGTPNGHRESDEDVTLCRAYITPHAVPRLHT